MKGISDLLGRIFISLIFFLEVIDTIFLYGNMKETMTSYGITWMQDALIITVITMLIIGATLVAIGYFARFGALLLLLYILPYTFIVFSFWNDPLDLQRVNAMNFVKHLAIAGGLLILIAHGSGKYSVKRLIHVMKLPQ